MLDTVAKGPGRTSKPKKYKIEMTPELKDAFTKLGHMSYAKRKNKKQHQRIMTIKAQEAACIRKIARLKKELEETESKLASLPGVE